jgi:hypothetical protein
MRETTLGGNRWKDEVQRLRWKVKGDEAAAEVEDGTEATEADFDVVLNPLQIRTFVAEFQKIE